MRKFTYEGVNKQGRTVTGTTMATNEHEVKAQLVQFGFSKITIKQDTDTPTEATRPARTAEKEQVPDDLVQKLIDGDIVVEEPAPEGEPEEDEWFQAEAFARIRKFRRRQNIALVITLIILGSVIAYFIYDRLTEIPAPQPTIITKSKSEMLSFKDVYVDGPDLVFVISARNWNGNVRVDYQAWDAFDTKIDFGIARLGFIGDHYGGSPEKSGAIRLKKYKFYERIELLVSGDEDR